jgi:hypothetical protein
VESDIGNHVGSPRQAAVTYLQAVLGLIQIINWVMSKMDEQKRAKAMALLWEQDFMKRDKEILNAANAARAALEQRLRDDPNRLREPDPFERSDQA